MRSFKLIALAAFAPALLVANWEILDMPTDRGFGEICAINEQTIFVIGHQGLWETFDGKEWVLDSTYQPSFIYFADDTLGFLWGSIVTTDGGHTWRKGDTVNGNVVPVNFARGQSLVGYGLGYDYVSKTTDGGWHWNQLPPLPDVYPGFDEIIDPSRISFPAIDTGYLTAICIKKLSESEIEDHQSYFKTTDGGQTWVLNQEGLYNDDFNPYLVDFPQNPSVGYMAGAGKVFKTTDGGETWDTVLKDLPHICSICFPETDQVGYVFGDSLAHRTTDGGQTWQKAVFTHDSIFGHCHFLNNSVGFITGSVVSTVLTLNNPYYPGFVMKTTDGLLGIAEEDWVDVQPALIELSAPSVFSDKLEVFYDARERVRLKTALFDAAGREVESLGWRDVGCGSGSLPLSGADLPSGVYFIRVESASTQLTQTLRVVKIR